MQGLYIYDIPALHNATCRQNCFICHKRAAQGSVSGGNEQVEVMLWDTEAGPGGPGGDDQDDLGGVYRCNFLPSIVSF